MCIAAGSLQRARGPPRYDGTPTIHNPAAIQVRFVSASNAHWMELCGYSQESLVLPL